ncbi:MAG: iron-containing alcohol dehydrogenase, partial [Candidatus Helarchaeales archaeon]
MSLNVIRVPRIHHGIGSLKELKNLREKRVFVVTDKIMREIHGSKIERYLKKKEFQIFDEVEPDPFDRTIIKGGSFAREFKPDLIIGLGGGSVMDVAKGVFFLYEREDKALYDMNPIKFFKLGKKSRLILIPTTSGTGAEHTWGIIVTNSETGQKIALACTEIIPDSVILDPKLAASMPPKLTAATGMDAFVHAIESMMSSLNNEFTEACCLHAIKLIYRYLPEAIKNGDELQVREKMHFAASIAGMALANSGAALAHSCGHALGAIFKVQHGVAVGLMLPYIIEFNRKECESQYLRMLEALQVDDKTNPPKILAELVMNLLRKIELATSIRELGIEEEKFK